MIYLCFELDMGCSKGVVGGKLDSEIEYSSYKWAVLGPKDIPFPSEHVFTDRSGTTAAWWIISQIGKFFLYTSQ